VSERDVDEYLATLDEPPVFCHGMVMGWYLTTLVGHRDLFVLNMDYCGISRIRAASNGIRTAVSANETGHLREARA
jgi:hypothetical protein